MKNQMIAELEMKVNELASKVIPMEYDLQGFLNLDLKSKLVGIATFAHMGKDVDIKNFALKGIEYLEAR